VSWGRIDDRLPMSVKIRGLADPGAVGDRAKRQRNEALGHWLQVLAWVSGERTDGFVTADILDLFGTEASAERLLRARYDRAPLLHRLGEICACLDGRKWPADFEFAVHDYLDRNPSRGENDVHRAKKRELRDPKLKREVRDRDRDCCRYCGKQCAPSDRVSDDGLTFDHVDPEVANGMNNLVVACRGCNNRKARRTPEQADMVLTPPPSSMEYLQPTCDRPTTVAGPVTGPDLQPSQVPVTGLTADQRQVVASSQTQTSPGRDGGGTGTAAGVGPPPPRRPSAQPSPYAHRPNRAAGHPRAPDRTDEYVWPPGSVPATSRTEEEP